VVSLPSRTSRRFCKAENSHNFCYKNTYVTVGATKKPCLFFFCLFPCISLQKSNLLKSKKGVGLFFFFFFSNLQKSRDQTYNLYLYNCCAWSDDVLINFRLDCVGNKLMLGTYLKDVSPSSAFYLQVLLWSHLNGNLRGKHLYFATNLSGWVKIVNKFTDLKFPD